MEIGNRWSQLAPKNVQKHLNEFTPTTSDKEAGSEVIKEFLYQKDVASWFRGTSHYHIKGANKLFNALRDDGEQGTTHRVRSCLTLIGLKPMITSKQIKFLMQLSRGNDLVFLWFLMEKHYKKAPKVKTSAFSQNEQLICSAICHLDMVTTLRELDKILPHGHKSDSEMKKKSIRHQNLKADSKTGRKKKVSPYFVKYTRPQHYGKCLFIKEPNFRVNFKYYRHFNNPNYPVQNESNRWYANYHFSPGKRVVYSIIYEIIKNVFYGNEAAALKEQSGDVLCGYHKNLRAFEANLKHELKVKAKNECVKQINQKKKDKANKVISSFHEAVQQQMCILSHQTRTAPKNYTLKSFTSEGKVYDVILGGSECSKGDFNTTPYGETSMKRKPSLGMEKREQRTQERMDYDDIFANFSQDSMRNCDIRHKPHKEHFKVVNDDSPIASCDAFFKRPLNHRPYKFDYHKIFSSFKHKEDSKIRKIIAKILNENTSNLSIENEQRSQILYDNVVEAYVKKTLERALAIYEAAAAENSSPLKRYPSSALYSGENFLLMDQMLFEAFQHLRKNPKFVWAQLPDAHKVPFLREWIAHRFGKEYTPAERTKSYRRSCLVFRALERSCEKLPVPNSSSIGKHCFIDYNCRKHLARKVQQLKSQYYHSLDCHLLEHTRVFWFAMRGYICSNGPPRKSFYAYMPSRLQDIHHFCLWKSSEYHNNWNAWNDRRKTGAL